MCAMLRRFFQKTFPVVALFWAFVSACGDVADTALLWMVDSPDIDQRGNVNGYVSPEGLTATAARVVAVDADGAAVYLNLCYDSGAGYFEETAISLAKLTADYKAGPIWASLDALGDNVEAYSYAIELGTMVGDSWTTLAVSALETYASIETFVQYSPLEMPAGIWKPTAYAAPEPSSALLFLIGGALLALRRKKEFRS